jgi:hypothetical protein
MNKVINFSNPFNGRKWLSILEPNKKFGLLFKKNLNIKKSYLGFSIRSNNFGLRGPDNTNANDVICGTSFAMGSSVDIGKNWYEHDDEYRKLFNIGMPIGFIQHLNLLKKYYSGSYDRLIFLYHPNIWITNKKFYKADKEQSNIFDSSRWSTNIFNVTYLYFKWRIKEILRHLLGKKITVIYNNKQYHINPNYSFFPVSNYKDIKNINSDFKKLSSEFKKIIVIKIPIKEEIALKYNTNFSTHLQPNGTTCYNINEN